MKRKKEREEEIGNGKYISSLKWDFLEWWSRCSVTSLPQRHLTKLVKHIKNNRSKSVQIDQRAYNKFGCIYSIKSNQLGKNRGGHDTPIPPQLCILEELLCGAGPISSSFLVWNCYSGWIQQKMNKARPWGICIRQLRIGKQNMVHLKNIMLCKRSQLQINA